MSTILLRYIALFFLLTSIGLAILSIYRGEMIANYQAEALKAKTVEVKVILDSVAIADKISKDLDIQQTVITIEKEKSTHEIKEIIKDPIYLNTCFDDAGMQQLSKAVLAPYASEHTEPVQDTGNAK